MKFSSFDVVLFDCDGVLIDSMPANHRAWTQALKEEAVSVDAAEYFNIEGMKPIEVVRYFMGNDIDEAKAKFLAASKDKYFIENETAKLYPKTLEMLKVASEKPLGLVTGGGQKRLQANAAYSDLKNYMQVIITADDVQKGKPNPEPYLKAAEKLDVSAERILVIENAPLGIQSAKAAGMTCLAIETTLSADKLNDADQTFKTHEDLISFFKREDI